MSYYKTNTTVKPFIKSSYKKASTSIPGKRNAGHSTLSNQADSRNILTAVCPELVGMRTLNEFHSSINKNKVMTPENNGLNTHSAYGA